MKLLGCGVGNWDPVCRSAFLTCFAVLFVGACGGGDGDTCTASKISCGGEATPGNDASVPDGGSAPDASAPQKETPEGSSCTPKPGLDVPDDDFADSNCDGIDGDKTRAIFVAPSGDDGAAGTLDRPVQSISKAVALATTAAKDVYVCNGTYAGPVSITAAVSLYGGYDCVNGWRRINDRATVAATTTTALTIRGVMGPMTIDRLGFRSADALMPGESSIAALIAGSTAVRIVHAMFEAGAGADGKPGDAVAARGPGPDGAQGEDLMRVNCYINAVTGDCARYGAGGIGFAPGSPTADFCNLGAPGGHGANGRANATTEPGQTIMNFLGESAPGGAVGHEGSPGWDGKSGAAGVPAQSGFGSVTENGYAPTNIGTSGARGTFGISGGGGSGGLQGCAPSDCSITQQFYVGGGGGSGGSGGCGGTGGNPGGGGGASIGLLVINSPNVTLAWTMFRTSNGGRGGSPSAGGAGGAGGKGGRGGTGTGVNGYPAGDGWAGGKGGNGGPGGPGGPGGGGPSIALLAEGSAPMLTLPDYQTGIGGKGGRGIAGGDGADGLTQDVVLLGADGGMVATDAGASRD